MAASVTGGLVLGAAAGAAGAYYLGEEWWIGLIIGVAIGALVGYVVGAKSQVSE